MSGKRKAIATLLYSADYLPGVFTLGHQLKKLREEAARNTSLLLLVSRDLYQDGLNESSTEILRKLFNSIIVVDPIKGSTVGNTENLKLLQRSELHFTLVKARLWELDYDEVLYLDGDTLPLSSDIFKLFDYYPIKKNEIGGAPDVGWPDMFNSGVLLLSPDVNLAHALQKFIATNVSMDGADQGILNQFFNAHCSKSEIGKRNQRWVRIPFIYNVTMPNYGYQNSPATKFFRQQCKIVHFIGEKKPWKHWCAGNKDNGYYSSQWNRVFLEFQTENSLSQTMGDLNLGPTLPAWKEPLNQLDRSQNMSDVKPGPTLPTWKEPLNQLDRSQNMSDAKPGPTLPAWKEPLAVSDRSQSVGDVKLECALPAWKESLVQSKQEPERIFPDEPPQQPVSTPPAITTMQFKSVVSAHPPSTEEKAIRARSVERVFPEDDEL